MHKISKAYYMLKTGRVIPARGGVIGLDPAQPGRIFEGYDGLVDVSTIEDYYFPAPPLSQAEREEIADYMIAQWQEFRRAAGPHAERALKGWKDLTD